MYRENSEYTAQIPKFLSFLTKHKRLEAGYEPTKRPTWHTSDVPAPDPLEAGYEPTKRPTWHTSDVPAPDPHAVERESARGET